MTRPDLASPAVRSRYRGELRGLYRPWRRGGLLLSVAGLALIAWPRMGGPWMLGPWPMQYWGVALVALAWSIFAGVIVARSRYHRARMAEPAEG